MGSPRGEGLYVDEPDHVVWLSAFCIDRLETTDALYSACVTAGACSPEPLSYPGTGPDYPIPHLHFEDAVAFCAWSGKAAPSEAQWEKAARGGCEIVPPPTCGPEDERPYPWGDSPPTCDKANFALDPDRPWEGCVGSYDVVGRRPAGASPYGALDMAGNRRELVNDTWSEHDYELCGDPCIDPRHEGPGERQITRGGNYHEGASDIVVTRRMLQEHNSGTVRCALDL